MFEKFGIYLLFAVIVGPSVFAQSRLLSLSEGKNQEQYAAMQTLEIDGLVFDTKQQKLVTVSDSLAYDDELSARWLTVDPFAAQYTSIAPYTFCANNPLSFYDGDGNLLRDQQGNLVVLKEGSTVRQDIVPGLKIGGPNGFPVIAKTNAENVTIYSNSKQKISAVMYTGKTEYFYQNAQGQLVKIEDAAFIRQAEATLDISANCHGVTIANGQLFISNEQIKDELMTEAEFKTVPRGEATTVVYTKNGEAEHSAKKEGETYTVDDGHTKTKTNQDERGASKNGKYKNPVFKKEVEKRREQKGGQVKGKLRILEAGSKVQQ